MFTSIVVAVDGSEPAMKAVRAACTIAKATGGDIHLVHSPEITEIVGAMGYSSVAVPVEDERVQKAGRLVMEKASALAAEQGCTVSSETLGNGMSAAVVLDAVDQKNADLVVLGRRGLGNLAELVLGSTSQQVSHEAPCAVLTIK